MEHEAGSGASTERAPDWASSKLQERLVMARNAARLELDQLEKDAEAGESATKNMN